LNSLVRVPLGEVAKLNPTFKSKAVAADELVDFLPMSAVNAELTNVCATEQRQFSEVQKGYTNFADGDVLLAKITPCFENGKIAFAKLKTKYGFGSTEFHVIRADRERLDGRYLVHFLRRDEVRVDGARNMRGSAGQRRVPKHYLESLSIPLQTLNEQRRIAAILDQTEALRAKRREALAQLDSLTQSIFIAMFGDPTTNPKQWRSVALDQLVRKDDTINYGVVQPGDALDVGIPLVRVGDVVDGNFESTALKRIDPTIEAAYKRSRLKGDEILVTCVGSIGVVALVEPFMKGYNIARAVSRIPASDVIDRTFLASYLQTDFVQRYFTSELRTVSQPTLNIKQICETKVIQPPLPLQQSFASRVQSVEALKATHKAALQELDRLFTSLQHRAFQGEL